MKRQGGKNSFAFAITINWCHGLCRRLCCFLDILGFRNYINKNTQDKDEIKKVFSSIENVKEFFNNNSEMGIKAAFFSDSIVLSSENNLYSFLFPIDIIEYVINSELGLLLRGSIVKGEYYHENNIAFGPAVIEAYNVQEKAVTSRIVVKSDNIVGSLEFFKDIDGEMCVNPYSKMYR